MIRTLVGFAILFIFTFEAAPALGCRMVCGNRTLWHLFQDEATQRFTVLKESEPIVTGLICHFLPAHGSELEREELRMINFCETEPDSNGNTTTLRTDLLRRRGHQFQDSRSQEKIAESVEWLILTRPKAGEPVQERRVVFPRSDCGSSEES